MAAESTSVVNDDIVLLREAIKRISNGGNSVTYGELAKDESVEQTFEALLGTLKASRKRGLITFEGELLLLGQHDDVPITLVDDGEADEEAAAPAQAEVSTADTSADVGEVAADTATTPEVAEPPLVEEAPVEEAAVEEAPAVVSEEPPDEATDAPARPELHEANTTDTFEPLVVEKSAEPEPSTPPAQASAPACEETSSAGAPAEDAPVGSTKSLGDGKWGKVETSYVDWRTADPDRLEVRRSATQELGEAGMNPSKSEKDKDGKWKVDVSYVNHRTADVERLEGRQSLKVGSVDSLGAGTASSATVKKESDGKWKVDTSYIACRTGDTANLERKGTGLVGEGYADPAEKTYTYEELRGASNRPSDVDPAKKEAYIADEEFLVVMGVSRPEFDKMPKWKQQNLKKAKDIY